jgi:uncharacterized lipoprotein YddW (UPF0748 family)
MGAGLVAMSTPSTISPISAETAQMPRPRTRGYFLNLVPEVEPEDLAVEIRRVAAAGFNLLIFPIYSDGWTLFPSEAATEHRQRAIHPKFRRWDPLALTTTLAAQEGLTVWGFVRPHGLSARAASPAPKLLRAFPKWRLRAHPKFQDRDARVIEARNACPINHDYRRFVGDILCEVSARYPIDGLVLNFSDLRLTGGSLESQPFCFCDACRLLYYQEFGADLLDDARDEMLGRARLWQMEQAQETLDYLRHRLTRARRTLRVVCRADPQWRLDSHYEGPPAPGAILMDWPELLDSGLVEELVVDHAGEECGGLFSARVSADYACLGDRVLFLPMARIEKPEELEMALAAQERLPIPGLIAEFPDGLAEDATHWIRENCFPEDVMLPESNPTLTAAYLLDRVRQQYAQQPILHDLLGDILRLVGRQLPAPDDFSLLEVIEENLHGLEQAIRRQQARLEVDEGTMCDLGLARRFIRLACMDVRS